MLVGPDDRIGILAGDRTGRCQAIAGQHDGKPAAVDGDADFAADGAADGEAGGDLALLLVANLADILDDDVMAGQRQRIDEPAAMQRIRALAHAAVIVAAVIGARG